MKQSRNTDRDGIEPLFPPGGEKMTREEHVKRIKRVLKKEDFVTEKKLEAAIERLIDYVIYS